MTTTKPTPTAPKGPAAHGWRVTWPMISVWIGTFGMLIPYLLPYLDGRQPFTLVAVLPTVALAIAHLNHSPAPTPGGGTTVTPVLLALALAGWALLFAGAACSGPSAAVRTSYGIEEAHCIANERALVSRTGHTLEEDQRDLALERARCDAALAAIGGAP
jgi:hypothetical protein